MAVLDQRYDGRVVSRRVSSLPAGLAMVSTLLLLCTLGGVFSMGEFLNEDGEAPTVPTDPDQPKEVRRYPVTVVEFQRVETPFIIGTWIVCASLAKIGMWRTV